MKMDFEDRKKKSEIITQLLKYMHEQYAEINKIPAAVRARLDCVYDKNDSGKLDINLWELAAEAGCAFDFEVPDVSVTVLKDRSNYFPDEYLFSVFENLDKNGLLLYNTMNPDPKDFLLQRIKSNPQYPAIYPLLRASLFTKAVEKLF